MSYLFPGLVVLVILWALFGSKFKRPAHIADKFKDYDKPYWEQMVQYAGGGFHTAKFCKRWKAILDTFVAWIILPAALWGLFVLLGFLF